MPDIIAANEPILALILLGVLFATFIFEPYPPEVTATGMAALFIVLGLVDEDAVMGVFSNSAPITIAAMFIVSGALIRTGYSTRSPISSSRRHARASCSESASSSP